MPRSVASSSHDADVDCMDRLGDYLTRARAMGSTRGAPWLQVSPLYTRLPSHWLGVRHPKRAHRYRLRRLSTRCNVLPPLT